MIQLTQEQVTSASIPFPPGTTVVVDGKRGVVESVLLDLKRRALLYEVKQRDGTKRVPEEDLFWTEGAEVSWSSSFDSSHEDANEAACGQQWIQATIIDVFFCESTKNRVYSLRHEHGFAHGVALEQLRPRTRGFDAAPTKPDTATRTEEKSSHLFDNLYDDVEDLEVAGRQKTKRESFTSNYNDILPPLGQREEDAVEIESEECMIRLPTFICNPDSLSSCLMNLTFHSTPVKFLVSQNENSQLISVKYRVPKSIVATIEEIVLKRILSCIDDRLRWWVYYQMSLDKSNIQASSFEGDEYYKTPSVQIPANDGMPAQGDRSKTNTNDETNSCWLKVIKLPISKDYLRIIARKEDLRQLCNCAVTVVGPEVCGVAFVVLEGPTSKQVDFVGNQVHQILRDCEKWDRKVPSS